MGTGRSPSGSHRYVRVSSDWFMDVVTYFGSVDGAEDIKDMLEDKLEKLQARENYSKSHGYDSKMSGNIQIDSTLFDSVAAHISSAGYDSSLDNVYRETNEKLEALKLRDRFTEYKTAPAGSEEREQARNDYLDSTDILPDFRSDKEQSL